MGLGTMVGRCGMEWLDIWGRMCVIDQKKSRKIGIRYSLFEMKLRESIL